METVIEAPERKVPTTLQEINGNNACRHYWAIESAHGPVSMGECKYCHQTREFHNSMRGIEYLRRHGA